ncbi:hypothetical protein Poli38472_008654 [Pythium oligandrum]|uniref:Uncharacterized protein n=1 Tax=Pythium oligandrum TaxID=41045 RepID=A0A8K1C3Y2_PYTOL|nr:hypothetical protein Poli38472_008654 [Pythium oligandrum]|eukprot:TMW56006.1 hypothetical protein Poli38472_008654 [Pythium oligandrum]
MMMTTITLRNTLASEKQNSQEAPMADSGYGAIAAEPPPSGVYAGVHSKEEKEANATSDATPLLPKYSTDNGADKSSEPLLPLRDFTSFMPTGLSSWGSWWSVVFFSWCEYLVSLSAERPLKLEDIWALDESIASLTSVKEMRHELERTGCIRAGFFISQKRVLISSGALMFISVLCEWMTPIAVYKVVDAAGTGEMNSIWSTGAFWTVILLASRFMRSFLLSWSDFILNYAHIRATASIQMLLLEYALSHNRFALGKRGHEEATNLFANDTKAVGNAIKQFHRLWALPLELGGLFYILHILAGDIMGYLLMFSVGIYLLIQLLTVRETYLFKKWLSVSDRRFAELTRTFEGVLGVKLNSWQEKAMSALIAIREKERWLRRRHILVRVIRMTLMWATPSLNLIATGVFLVYIPNNALKSPALTFASVSIFHAINDTFTEMWGTFHVFLKLRVSFNRIQAIVPMCCKNGITPCELPDPVKLQPGEVDGSENAVVLTNASFQDISSRSETLLNFVNLRIRRGEFIIAHGKVGSGKSVLLAAIAGLQPQSHGARVVRGSIAYCSQSPWIQSTSLRENILFGRPFDEVRYWNVLEACELLHDIKVLPHGDMTLVGSRSYVRLSSGQQSRIALARACYADADIYVLDSPLDSVDSIVQCDILLKCFGKLLQHKTIVLATHNPEIIMSEYADRQIFMDNMDVKTTSEGGSQRSQGGDRARSGSAAAFVSRRKRLLAETDMLGSARRKRLLAASKQFGASTQESEVSGSNLLLDSSILQHPSVKEIQMVVKTADYIPRPGIPRFQSLTAFRNRGIRSVLMEYLSYARRPSFLMSVVFFHLVTQILATSSIYTFSRWMSEVGELRYGNQMSSDEAFKGAVPAFQTYVISVAISTGAFFTAAGATYFFSLCVSDLLFQGMTNALLHTRMSFFAEHPVGTILNRYGRDLNTVDSSLYDSIFDHLKSFFGVHCALFASLAWMSGHILKASGRTAAVSEMESVGLQPITSWGLWILMMIGNLIVTKTILYYAWYVCIRSNKPCSELFLMQREAASPIFTFVSESIAGKSVISAFGEEQRDRMTAMYAAKLDHLTRISWAMWCFEEWLKIRSMLMENLITGALLTGLIFFGHDADPYRPATIGLLLYLVLNMRDDLKNIFGNWNRLEKDLVCLQRVFEYIHLEPEVSCNAELPSLADAMWPRQGSIAFTAVDFQYDMYIPPGEHAVSSPGKIDRPLILRNVNFKVRSGEKVGIIGRSGSGKSSLAMALLRINNPSHGVIQLDGVDITRVDLKVLRAKVCYLPPNPVFLSGSLREYLDPNGTANDFDLWNALSKTGLKASIRRLNSQLEGSLSDIVMSWSNGERQLLCLARALLLRARVVFLDEATTATDQETDFSVQSVVVQSLDKDMTLMCISHRLDSVLSFDKLMVFSDGQVTGFGTVSELVASGDNEFLDLLESAQLVY